MILLLISFRAQHCYRILIGESELWVRASIILLLCGRNAFSSMSYHLDFGILRSIYGHAMAHCIECVFMCYSNRKDIFTLCPDLVG